MKTESAGDSVFLGWRGAGGSGGAGGGVGGRGAACAAAGRAAAGGAVLRGAGRTAGHDVEHLVAVYGFPLHEGLHHGFHLVAVVFQDVLGDGVLLVKDAADFGIHFLHGGFADVGGFGDAAAEEDFAFVFGIDHGAEFGAHAVAGDHVAGDFGGALVVVGGAGGDFLDEQVFRDAAAEQDADFVEHLVVIHAVFVALGQLPGHAQGAAAGHDGDFVHGVGAGQHFGDDGVAGFVVGGGAFFVVGHHHRAALGAHVNFVFGFFKVLHFDDAGVAAGGHEGGFVAEVGQVGAAHAGGAARDDGGAHVLPDGDFSHVHAQDLLAAADVGQGDVDLTVEAAGAQQGGIEDVGAVGGGHDDDAQVGFKAVHFHEHLVERLLAFIVAAAQARAALAADGVDLVDEDDAGGVFLGVFKHVAHAGRAHADKHFHEVGAADAEKGHFGFAGDGFGQQGFAGAGRADEQQPARDAAAQFLEFLRVFEKVHHFLDFFLGFVAAGHVGEGDLVVVFVQHAGLAFAEAECAALAAALHLAHEVNPHADEQQHGAPAHEQTQQQRAFFAGFDVEFDVVVDQIAHEAAVKVGGLGAHAALVAHGGFDFGAAGAFLDGGAFDAAVAHVLQKVGIGHVAVAAGGAFKLLEYGEQDEGHNQPDGDFGKHLIVQARLQFSGKKRGNKEGRHMRFILGISSCGRGGGFFQARADEEGFGRAAARGGGLDGAGAAEGVFEEFDELAVAAAVKDFGDERAFGLEVGLGKVHGQLDQVADAGGVGRFDAREVGGHVGDDDIDGAPGQRRMQAGQHVFFAEVAL